VTVWNPLDGSRLCGAERLDPEIIGAYLGPLLRAASTLCDSRESAEDLVQDTVARVLSRPRLLRGGDERAYLMQALRNTFVTNRRTAARRPHLVTTLEKLDPADRRTGARPEEALIARQVFPAIAQLPESFRLALVAVDIAGLSYGEAAQVLGAPQATITTRLFRARQRVARELDPERSEIRNRSAPALTAKERAPMKELQERKVQARGEDGERAVLGKIAEMPEPDRAMARGPASR
jgi:RNA polymerase sigma-70 factor, ECF subfamily